METSSAYYKAVISATNHPDPRVPIQACSLLTKRPPLLGPWWSHWQHPQARPRGEGSSWRQWWGQHWGSTKSRTVEPTESGKVALEGPWCCPLQLPQSGLQRGGSVVKAEPLQMSQPRREELAHSPTTSSSALGQPPQGESRAAFRSLPLWPLGGCWVDAGLMLGGWYESVSCFPTPLLAFWRGPVCFKALRPAEPPVVARGKDHQEAWWGLGPAYICLPKKGLRRKRQGF